LIPSQQSSFSGIRTAFALQLAIAATEAPSLGPSKMPQPWMQANSVPERLTPWSSTCVPDALISRLPSTWSAEGAAGDRAPAPAPLGAADTRRRPSRIMGIRIPRT